MQGNFEWYVVYTFSGCEAKAKIGIEKMIETRNMKEFFDEIRIPIEEITHIKGKIKKVTQKKVYPGYVFIRMILNDDTWHAVRTCRGVAGFVGPESKPLPLTEAEIKRLGGHDGKVSIVKFKAGDSVVVISGPLEGFVGMVVRIEMDKDRAVVKLNMFQRETEVELSLEQIEPFVT